MNSAKYEALPADLRQIIDRNSGRELSHHAGEIWDSTIEPARSLAKARGNTFTTLTDDEYARWVNASKPVIAEWIKEVNAKGGDGEKLLQNARELIASHDR
jgi:TRAP-type C4-dicarboxylate transport system substrate-binding protein